MNKRIFWEQVARRSRENKKIAAGGMPAKLAPAMEAVGLHFWKVGLGLSLIASVWMWGNKYQIVMRAVRAIVWR